MRHYEIVFLVHPDQSEQVPNLIQRYKDFVENDGGTTHRVEDWGKHQLAYPINKLSRAHYVLMNVECTDKALAEIANNFCFNDSIMRNLITKCETAGTSQSAMLKAIEQQAAATQESSGYSREPIPEIGLPNEEIIEEKGDK